jgi:hypothetical protein
VTAMVIYRFRCSVSQSVCLHGALNGDGNVAVEAKFRRMAGVRACA